MPLPSRRRAREYTAKALEAGARTLGAGPDQRAARRLGAQLAAAGSDPAHEGPRVLFLTPRDWAFHVQLEGLLGLALRIRGAEVSYLRCGGDLPICDRTNTHEGPPMPCRSCDHYVRTSLDAFGHEQRDMASLSRPDDPEEWPELDDMSLAELAGAEVDGIPVGELMDIPVRWFLLSARLEDDPIGADTLRDFLRSARRVLTRIERAIDEVRPTVVVMLNGLFSFESIARALCARRDIDVVTYERTHRAGALVFAANSAANRYDLSAIWRTRAADGLDEAQEAALDEYLDSRRVKGHPLLDIWRDAREVELDRPDSGRLVALFSNVTWDSSVIGRDVGFDSMHHWLDTTVRYFADRPQHSLIVRAHPAEAKRVGKETREPVADHLRASFDHLPPNVRFVGAEEDLSSYPLMEAAEIGLVYTSTVGIEMAVMGKPVVVAGRAHYRDLGFTNDPASPEAYVRGLDALLEDPAGGVRSVELARRYAYTFFFDAPIPVGLVREPHPGLARLEAGDLDDLRPGVDPELDRICAGILGAGGASGYTPFLRRA